MISKKYISIITAAAMIASAAVAIPAFAQTTTPPPQGQGIMRGGQRGLRQPRVFGTVSAINGTTLTVASKGFGTSTPATTFSVDASNATVMKNNATSTVSAIATGDTVAIQGTVSGTNVTATMIRDGVMPMQNKGGRSGFGNATSSPIQGNGQPIVAGTVSSVSGSTITLTNKSNVTYTVDASNAKIVKNNATSTISNVTVGDTLVVQGTINGNSVVASSVIDQTHPGSAATSTTNKPQTNGGFFGQIGKFFMHLFGF